MSPAKVEKIEATIAREKANQLRALAALAKLTAELHTLAQHDGEVFNPDVREAREACDRILRRETKINTLEQVLK